MGAALAAAMPPEPPLFLLRRFARERLSPTFGDNRPPRPRRPVAFGQPVSSGNEYVAGDEDNGQHVHQPGHFKALAAQDLERRVTHQTHRQAVGD